VTGPSWSPFSDHTHGGTTGRTRCSRRVALTAQSEDSRPRSAAADLADARATVARQARQLGLDALVDDARLVVSELVANAVLHGGGCRDVRAVRAGRALRIEVRDASRVPPVLGWASEQAMTGRGLRLVATVASRWGVAAEDGGKVVWVELTGTGQGQGVEAAGLMALWDDLESSERRVPRYRVELGDVPTGLLLAAKSHVDNLVREFTLAAAGARSGLTAEVPPHLAHLIETVVGRFADARLAIKYQALAALHRNASHIRLRLDLPVEAADAALDYVDALDEVDAYCRAMRFLTLETPPQHRVFRRWYIEELVSQLRSAAAGRPAPPAQSFEERLLKELDHVTRAQWASERAARLYRVAIALASATSPEAVAQAVITEGRAALAASGSGLLLATDSNRLSVTATVGYDEGVVSALRRESPDAELPAATALRTGEPIWLESRHERDERFPELVDLEATTVSMCAVPLVVHGRRLGALRFSFTEARLFDEDERHFVLALAAQSAQALDREQLQQARISVSRRLQRSLLPPRLPQIPGVEVAALYHPFGDEVDVGGDFYDIWTLGHASNQWAFAIGDASGTGPEAAALTAQVRYTMRALTMTDARPASVLESLNQALVAHVAGGDSERFCTAILGILTVSDEGVVLDLASGGHPYPISRRADGSMTTVRLGGSLLGQFDPIEVAEHRLVLEPGDVCLMFTDGVVEGRSGGSFFDTSRIRRVLDESHHSAQRLVTALGSAVLAFSGGRLNDDVAAVAIRVREPGPEQGS
jgi:serine phosphatase RsbU (regulator of sigma subunit)/anti-sigma regulatory factor (Ser/Thr protein kinase)